jgi:sugar phosphate permease
MAVGLYLGRMALSQMDVPTRQSFIVGVVKEDERTAAAGFTNISRNVAQSISPTILGSVFQSAYFLAAPFLLAGVVKIGYDVLLYINFKSVKASNER